jgi:hypothetical protein
MELCVGRGLRVLLRDAGAERLHVERHEPLALFV